MADQTFNVDGVNPAPDMVTEYQARLVAKRLASMLTIVVLCVGVFAALAGWWNVVPWVILTWGILNGARGYLHGWSVGYRAAARKMAAHIRSGGAARL